jgi:hypothetical protein
MSSSEYPADTPERQAMRVSVEQLREELEALVRERASSGGRADGEFSRLAYEVERLRSALESCGPHEEITNVDQSCADMSANPPYPPYPPFPPYPPVAPFPPYPPYPPNCGCCAPAPCGCGKSSPPPAPRRAEPEPVPAAPPPISSSSSPAASSSSQSWRSRVVVAKPSSSSSSSRFWTDVR